MLPPTQLLSRLSAPAWAALLSLWLLPGLGARAQTVLTGPSGSGTFGASVTMLPNGNFVVRSLSWDNGTAADVGATTWGSASAGVSGAVSTANSLVGTKLGDNVSEDGMTALPNGHYVVRSAYWNNGAVVNAGAATWVNGSTGTGGVVSVANSLVGSKNEDRVSESGVTVLTNGHYVVSSTRWDNGAATDAGAATWGNGSTGTTGTVSAANSLVGTTANDNVSKTGVSNSGESTGGVTALPDGNYVVHSLDWDNGG